VTQAARQAPRVQDEPRVQGLDALGEAAASPAERARVAFYLLAMTDAEAALAAPDPDLAHERAVMAEARRVAGNG
jgi:hypothetical protein